MQGIFTAWTEIHPVPNSLWLARFVAPECLKAGITAALKTIELVLQRVFYVVILVVFFGGIECRGFGDFRMDACVEFLRHAFLARSSKSPLFYIVIENRRAILVAIIAKLAVRFRRIDVVPKDRQQRLVADLLGVVNDLHRFDVAGAAGGNLLVRRVFHPATDVARGGRDHPVELVVWRFHAPETSSGKRGFGGFRGLLANGPIRDLLAARSLTRRGKSDHGA